MAPVGNLKCETKLDHDTIHSPNDLVSGVISLTYHAGDPSAKTQELFGPLLITISLRCHVKAIVRENRTSHAFILFHEEYDAATESLRLFDGPFRMLEGEPQTFPIAIQFPGAMKLPPTFQTLYKVTAPRQTSSHQAKAWVHYSLHVKVDMPGIDVDISNPQASIEIRYKQVSSSPYIESNTREFERKMEVQTYNLLGEEDRPKTLLDKMKATAKRIPKPLCKVQVNCSKVPATLPIGRRISFEMRVRAEPSEGAGAAISDITFVDGKVEIIAVTTLFATNEKGVDSPTLEHEQTVAKLGVTKPDSGTAFSKANDSTQTITTEPVPNTLVASFEMKKLKRLYLMQMVMHLRVAGEIVVVKKAMDLMLLPEAPSAIVQAGPVRAAAATEGGHEELPTYEAVADDRTPILGTEPGDTG